MTSPVSRRIFYTRKGPFPRRQNVFRARRLIRRFERTNEWKRFRIETENSTENSNTHLLKTARDEIYALE